ncbi:hypothetical protein PF008_g31352 [Phytophthora fragariae]|uniref:Uncharacterized protein n=1 Tax=Phytophthora fragariae TaxID=53985 RepID=A0A6G0Q309_9STRA|nr:hypothetical protein PF008_g31352 [Phytophthora fragariae]
MQEHMTAVLTPLAIKENLPNQLSMTPLIPTLKMEPTL